MKPIACLLMLAASALLSGCVSPSPSALDLQDKPLNPFAETGITATVLIFVSNDCPISNRYVPELMRLQHAYAGRGVSFWLVHADAQETPAEIREHARQFGLTLREIRDPGHQLARLCHAEVTPTAAVFTPGRKLVYHGRIDDRLARLGLERAVPVPVTPAMGCAIP